MDIFARENIGRNIRCRLERDGDIAHDFVKWTHAMIGSIVNRKVRVMKGGSTNSSVYVMEVSKGWKVIEVGV